MEFNLTVSPHFNGLRVDKRSLNVLKNKSEEYQNSLQKAGGELSSVTDFNLNLDKNLNISINKTGDKNKKDYWKILKAQMNNAGQHYQVTDFVSGGEETHSGWYPEIPPILSGIWNKSSKNIQEEQYKHFKQMDEISQASSLTQMLSMKNSKNIEKSEAIISAYGVDMESQNPKSIFSSIKTLFKK